jgi:hypothetical protein
MVGGEGYERPAWRPLWLAPSAAVSNNAIGGTFLSRSEEAASWQVTQLFVLLVGRAGLDPATNE